MKLFSQVVRTLVNVAVLPVAVVKDVVTLGNTGNAGWDNRTYTEQAVTKLKDEARED